MGEQSSPLLLAPKPFNSTRSIAVRNTGSTELDWIVRYHLLLACCQPLCAVWRLALSCMALYGLVWREGPVTIADES